MFRKSLSNPILHVFHANKRKTPGRFFLLLPQFVVTEDCVEIMREKRKSLPQSNGVQSTEFHHKHSRNPLSTCSHTGGPTSAYLLRERTSHINHPPVINSTSSHRRHPPRNVDKYRGKGERPNPIPGTINGCNLNIAKTFHSVCE